MKFFWAALAGAALLSNPSPSRAEFNECHIITGVMSKLGREMAINRQIVATQGDTVRGELASEALAQQTKDYRLAKRQSEKADCVDRWSRD